MSLSIGSDGSVSWRVRKIAVIGPGIVGMPMAALLADAEIREGSDEPAKVVVVQRKSATSGWKVDAINRGESVIGGIEPGLDAVVRRRVAEGLLSATHDCADIADADVVLVSVQTDRKGFGPDYGPLMDALEHLAAALAKRPAGNVPLVVFESTLAPSSMTTLIRDLFARHGLIEGRDVLLGNSPNRVMPGRLVERVRSSDKIIGGLHPVTPTLIERLYSRVVTEGTLYKTNSMTAEVVKTLENAYRDVRIAFAAEVVRWCDAHDIDFFALRDAVNLRVRQSDMASADATAVPSGAVLVPTVGVGGHCLPKDGILLWWRGIESGADTRNSLILESRNINDESPLETLLLGERAFGSFTGKRIALLGTAYRFDSEDTRNSPTLPLARMLLARGCEVRIHDPYVRAGDQNVERFGLGANFSTDLASVTQDAEILVFCTGHAVYRNGLASILATAPQAKAVLDGANLFHDSDFASSGLRYAGIGRGRQAPSAELVAFVEASFHAVERGVANEVKALIELLNSRYAEADFNRVSFADVQHLAGTCVTGCAIAQPGPVEACPTYAGFSLRLAQRAAAAPAALHVAAA